jgi:hypothetical protein
MHVHWSPKWRICGCLMSIRFTVERDWFSPLELTLDLAIQGSLVSLNRQEEVGALLLELLKNAF